MIAGMALLIIVLLRILLCNRKELNGVCIIVLLFFAFKLEFGVDNYIGEGYIRDSISLIDTYR